eukprot:jgi/Chlat1/7770/Chrsp66S00571
MAYAGYSRGDNLQYQGAIEQAAEYLRRTLPGLIAYSEAAKSSLIQQVTETLQQFPTLAVLVKPLHADGSSTAPQDTLLVALEGTVPANISGSLYNIPVSIRCPVFYPQQAPAIYVTPGLDMMLAANHSIIDDQGRCMPPSIRTWHEGSQLASLVKEVSTLFGAESPVYSRPPSLPSTPVSSLPTPSTPLATSKGAYPKPVTADNAGSVMADVQDIDELRSLCAALSKQVQMLLAQDEEVENQLFAADDKLYSGELNLDNYLKLVRMQARQQLLNKALLAKVELLHQRHQQRLAALELEMQHYREQAATLEQQRRQAEDEEARRRMQAEEERKQHLAHMLYQQQVAEASLATGKITPFNLLAPSVPQVSGYTLPATSQPPAPLPFTSAPPSQPGLFAPPYRPQAQPPHQMYSYQPQRPPGYPAPPYYGSSQATWYAGQGR